MAAVVEKTPAKLRKQAEDLGLDSKQPLMKLRKAVAEALKGGAEEEPKPAPKSKKKTSKKKTSKKKTTAKEAPPPRTPPKKKTAGKKAASKTPAADKEPADKVSSALERLTKQLELQGKAIEAIAGRLSTLESGEEESEEAEDDETEQESEEEAEEDEEAEEADNSVKEKHRELLADWLNDDNELVLTPDSFENMNIKQVNAVADHLSFEFEEGTKGVRAKKTALSDYVALAMQDDMVGEIMEGPEKGQFASVARPSDLDEGSFIWILSTETGDWLQATVLEPEDCDVEEGEEGFYIIAEEGLWCSDEEGDSFLQVALAGFGETYEDENGDEMPNRHSLFFVDEADPEFVGLVCDKEGDLLEYEGD